jgi:hypothetical protein
MLDGNSYQNHFRGKTPSRQFFRPIGIAFSAAGSIIAQSVRMPLTARLI